MSMARLRKYPDELIQRGVRLGLESERPIAHIAADLGNHPETRRKNVRQAEADSGARPELLSSSEREKIRQLRKENYELRRANEILKPASVYFAKEVDPDRTKVSRYVDQYRGRFGVEPSCRVLGVSASAYYERASGRRSIRAVEDGRLLGPHQNCTRRTTTPTGGGGCGRRCGAKAKRPVAAASSG